MAFLFDTDAISEPLRRQPLPVYMEWLRTVPRSEQFTSAVVVGEQIAATAIRHGLVLVTGNLRHYERISGLEIEPVLDRSRRADG